MELLLSRENSSMVSAWTEMIGFVELSPDLLFSKLIL
jgi:hypothetical protein